MAESKEQILEEMAACYADPFYFIDKYCFIFDSSEGQGQWIRFNLWPEQVKSLDAIDQNKLVCILKARQLGETWLVLCYALWMMIFRPSAEVLLFSKRDEEATELLDHRLKGIYERLPDWMKMKCDTGSLHGWKFPNGSRAKAFPTTGGRSYTATLVIIDEADYVPDLNAL